MPNIEVLFDEICWSLSWSLQQSVKIVMMMLLMLVLDFDVDDVHDVDDVVDDVHDVDDDVIEANGALRKRESFGPWLLCLQWCNHSSNRDYDALQFTLMLKQKKQQQGNQIKYGAGMTNE